MQMLSDRREGLELEMLMLGFKRCTVNFPSYTHKQRYSLRGPEPGTLWVVDFHTGPVVSFTHNGQKVCTLGLNSARRKVLEIREKLDEK